jgi:hypothetical protein
MERKQSKDAQEFREEAERARAQGQVDLARQLEEWADQLEMGGSKPAKDLIGPAKPPAR